MQQITFEKTSSVFEKLVRDRHGRLFRVRFVIVERNGTLRGKVLFCTSVFEIGSVTDKELRIKDSRRYLPCAKDIRTVPRTRSKAWKNLSPFSRFDFLTVIKIRAPSGDADVRG